MKEQLPDPWRDLGEFIREQRAGARLSLRRLSDMAGISNPYLSQIERGLRHPSAEILQQIAKALAISAETLYVRAGILEERPENGDLDEAIRGEASLTAEQKQTLETILASFRRENAVAQAAAEAAAAVDAASAADTAAATETEGKAAETSPTPAEHEGAVESSEAATGEAPEAR